MTETAIQLGNIELVKLFISASVEADILSIGELLDDNGEFQMEDSKFKIVDGSKTEFLRWYNTKLEATKINQVTNDQCINCCFGKQVVLFNNGTFPRVPQEFTDTTKAGLMIESNEGKITKIMVCYNFLKTENKCVSQCIGRELVNLMEQGFSEEEAVAMYIANPNSEYGHLLADDNEDEFCDEDDVPF